MTNPTAADQSLNEAQRRACADYSGSIVSVSRKAGEYDDESTFGYAYVVTLSTGWRALVGRYGAVLDEWAPEERCTCGTDAMRERGASDDAIAAWSPTVGAGHLAYCPRARQR
jgi:hypothetical protein